MQDRFKRLLSEKNLTATHFAALIKVNASAISHILNGRSKPGFDLLDKIAQALPDVNMNWLITGKGSPYINKQTNVSPSIPSLSIDSSESVDEKVVSKSVPHKQEAASIFSSGAISDKIPKHTDKKIKRVIIFYEDGTFESYE